ncbi:hypothetical protein C5F48_00745 [Cereibacter changlensis JA139]|uniref:Capsular biosynthesis protein n=2 Tax=Cereibacter changlensis TaxID=402884 RepID=A0A2T4K123_9RHOB|nr:hypothetical protein [Cereibacter changlensis]PTE23813.1 hypothetical protein C5F48_00745 [Cereibacter changlensis JA139]PZX58974.1 hypothetical protein LX76_00479 [Cereibacter changlensis]
MPHDRVLNIYLPSPMCEDALAGRVNIVNRIGAAVQPFGLRLLIHHDSAAEMNDPERRYGWSIFHMQEPVGPRCLCLRRAYHYPFWQLEATNERWWFDVALAKFSPKSVDPELAKPFFRRWRERIVGDPPVSHDGFLFMPLQGRLTEHRSFQAMSPLAMIQATLAADPRPIRATLHPKERYSPRELRALEKLAEANPRFQLVQGDTITLLAACDLVVTQNSATALTGYFLKKPAVLFGLVDFQHIAGSVPHDGVEHAFAVAKGRPPDFAAYLYWFFHENTINAGAPEAEEQIRARMLHHKWQF